MSNSKPLRSPGRPRQFEADEIMNRAVELFWQKGYRATTTRDLQEVLGLGPSSIYNAFGSKEALLEAVLDRYEALTTDALLAPLKEANDGIHAIMRFFTSLQSWVSGDERHGCMLTNMMAEDGGATESARKRSQAYRNELRRELERILRKASEDGELRPAVDVAAGATLLVGLVLGINVAARGDASDEEISSLVAAVGATLDSFKAD